jgi:hypothetical protein
VRRALLLTVGTAVVTGVAAGLARDAKSIQPGIAKALLLGLLVFLVFEWVANFLGSRLWGPRIARADKAAWAALSSAGIWIALLAIAPLAVSGVGAAPVGAAGLTIVILAASCALGVKLWFLREIYEVEFDRAAIMWAASRGAAVLVVLVVATLYVVVGPAGGGAPPTLSLHP